MKASTGTTTLGDIARAARLSRVAVSYALRNQPGVSAATRKKVLALAQKLNYRPDARMNILMERVRKAKDRDLLPIAWLNTGTAPDIWQTYKHLSPYWEGARDRCFQLGYKLDEFWIREPGMNIRRISKILYNRGIRGIIIAPPDRGTHIRFRLNWEWFACVSFEKALVAPALHQVAQDRYYNLLLCLRRCRQMGFRRIAVINEDQSDRRAFHACQAAVAYFFSQTPDTERLPLIFSGPNGFPKRLKAWIRKYQPEVFIAQNNTLLQAVKEAGFKVPEEIGLIHTAVDDDCIDWAGIWSQKREIGAVAAESVINLIQNNQTGPPAVARDILIRGLWHEGRTLASSPRNTTLSSKSST